MPVLMDNLGVLNERGLSRELWRGLPRATDVADPSLLIFHPFVLSVQILDLLNQISYSCFVILLLSLIQPLIEVACLLLILQFFTKRFDFRTHALYLFVVISDLAALDIGCFDISSLTYFGHCIEDTLESDFVLLYIIDSVVKK